MAGMQGFRAQMRHSKHDVRVHVANVLACNSETVIQGGTFGEGQQAAVKRHTVSGASERSCLTF